MKDVIYLESDAEITEAIDKLKAAEGNEVKIVVPARSGLLQSVVNLKLLKRSAESSGKDLVLVTNDRTAKNLAGAVGLAVASSVKAAPKIPDPKEPEDEPDIVGEDEATEQSATDEENLEAANGDEVADGEKSVDDAKSAPAKASPMTSKRSIGGADDDKPAKASKDKSGKKLPDFNALQKRLWIGIGLFVFFIAALLGWIFLPKATVKLQVDAKKMPLNTKFITDASLTKSDYANQVLMARELASTKNLSTNFTASGKKDVGTKAAGTISIQNCDDANQHALAAGSIVATAGKNFTTNAAVTIPGGTTGGGKVNCSASVSVGVSATSAGESYNFGNTSFSLVGFSALFKASGSTSGGTTKQVTVVTQADVDNAKKAMLEEQEAKAKEELVGKTNKDNILIEDTFRVTVTNFKSSAAVGDEANNGTVSATAKYSMVEVPKSEIDKMLAAIVEGDVPPGSEIYDNGAQAAQYSFIKELSDTQNQIQLTSTAFYGSKLDREAIAKQVAGKSKKEVPEVVKQNQGVSGATVESWPTLLPRMPFVSSNIKVEPQVSTNK